MQIGPDGFVTGNTSITMINGTRLSIPNEEADVIREFLKQQIVVR